MRWRGSVSCQHRCEFDVAPLVLRRLKKIQVIAQRARRRRRCVITGNGENPDCRRRRRSAKTYARRSALDLFPQLTSSDV